MAYDLGSAHGKIELEYTGRRQVTDAQHDMDSLGKSGKKTESDLANLKKVFSSLGSAAAKLGKLGAIAIAATQIGAAAANATVQLAGMVPALASLTSLSAALPGLLVAGAASIGVLKAALAGVGDAITLAFSTKATDVKKFNESLKNLSPSAQKFVKSIQSAVPALKKVQQGIQETFFQKSGLVSAVPLATNALMKLRIPLFGLTAEFGRVTKQFVGFAVGSKSVGFAKASIDTFRKALADVRPQIIPVLNGLVDVGKVGLPLLARLGGAVGGVAEGFAHWLSAIASDGRLQTWIDTALKTLQTLGGIASNVGSILISVFQAAGDTAGGLLGNIEKLTGGFAEFLSSAEGAKAIRALFTGIASVASALTPVLTTLVGALAGALGPALADLARGVGPVLLQVVQALAPAFAPLAAGFVAVLNAVTPLLVPLGNLVAMLAQLVGGALSSIAAELGPVIQLFAGAFTDALQTFAPVLNQVITQGLPLAASAGIALLQAFAPLAPVLVQLAQALADAFVANLPEIISLMQQLIPQIAQFATALSGSLGAALAAIIPLIPTLVNVFVGFLTVFYSVQGALLGMYTGFLNFVTFLTTLPGIIGSALTAFYNILVSALTTALNYVIGWIPSIVGFFTALPGRIGAVLAALPGVVVNIIKNMATDAAFFFGAAIGALVTIAVQAPGRIGAAFIALVGIIGKVISAAWNGGKALFSAGVAAITSFASSAPGRVGGAISGLKASIINVIKSAWSGAKSAFSSGVNAVVSLARTLPGKIVSGLGGLAGQLRSAAADAIAGFVGGIRAGIGAAADAARSLGSSVLSGIKSTLRISSPSKEMYKVGTQSTDGLNKGLAAGRKQAAKTAAALGRYVVQGYKDGINGSAAQIKSASVKLANMVNDAFAKNSKGVRAISAGQKNSVLATISKGTAQLLKLTSQSNTVSARLKTAQANLADIQKQYNDTYASAVAKTKDTFNIVTPGQTFINLDLTKQRFQQALDQAKQFAKDIATLTKRGLSKDLIQQLVDAGAADGGAMATALATSSDATIKQFNSLQGQLNSAANSVGKTTADALYGAGLKAAQGLVKGLQQQEAAIQKEMDKIANGMINSIKKALKIKSPSRIMFDLGAFTSQGLIDGLKSLRDKVTAAAQSLATSSIIPTVKLGVATGSLGAQAARTKGVGPGLANTNVFNQTVNALPGMSAKQVSNYALQQMRYALATGVSAASLPTPSPAGV